MLICHQIGVCLPPGGLRRAARVSHPQSSSLCASSSYTSRTHVVRCRTRPALAYGLQQHRPITCLFGGGKGEPEKDDGDTLWKSLEKAVENLKKERSVEGILREQLQKQELDGGGGSGDFRNGRGDGSGDSEDEESESVLDEFIQVILATGALTLLYVYIIKGEELFRLVKDYIKYLFGATPSVRLKRTLNIWQRLFQSLVRKEVVGKDEIDCSLEDLLFITQTWWHDPGELFRHSRRKMARKTRKRATWPSPAS